MSIKIHAASRRCVFTVMLSEPFVFSTFTYIEKKSSIENRCFKSFPPVCVVASTIACVWELRNNSLPLSCPMCCLCHCGACKWTDTPVLAFPSDSTSGVCTEPSPQPPPSCRFLRLVNVEHFPLRFTHINSHHSQNRGSWEHFTHTLLTIRSRHLSPVSFPKTNPEGQD